MLKIVKNLTIEITLVFDIMGYSSSPMLQDLAAIDLKLMLNFILQKSAFVSFAIHICV